MRTILVADDEAGIRGLVQMVLGPLGYRILEAASPEQALGIAGCGRIDLLITDVVMPGGGGRVLADRLTERDPAMKVLFVSGSVADALLIRRIEGGEVSFLPKPFSAAALQERVRALLGCHPANSAAGIDGRPDGERNEGTGGGAEVGGEADLGTTEGPDRVHDA